MIVLHVISGLGRGGAETMLQRLIDGHDGNSRYRHVVVSLGEEGVLGAQLRASGVTVHALGMRGPADLARGLLRLVSTIRAVRPDIVQTWMYHADLLGGFAARLAGGVPVIWGIHSFDLKRGGSARTRFIQRMCAWTSSVLPVAILCVAESSRRAHVAVGYDDSKFVVIPNGFDPGMAEVDPDRVAAFRAALGLRTEHVVIGCVGRFNRAKDHGNFVAAAARVASSRPQARFLMVGRGLDKANAVLASWIESAGIADRCLLLGERDDVPVALAAMDVFCSSSRTEAFPLVVGEAMLLGRAAVVTDAGDTAFLVGDTAIVVERENDVALADALIRLIDAGPEQRHGLGRRAQERVRSKFSMKTTRSLTEALYERVLQRPGARLRGGQA